MSAELEPLLRESLDAAAPEWLERLVAERVVACVRDELTGASPAADGVSAGARTGDGGGRGWRRALPWLASWLAARRDRARAASVARQPGWAAARATARSVPRHEDSALEDAGLRGAELGNAGLGDAGLGASRP